MLNLTKMLPQFQTNNKQKWKNRYYCTWKRLLCLLLIVAFVYWILFAVLLKRKQPIQQDQGTPVDTAMLLQHHVQAPFTLPIYFDRFLATRKLAHLLHDYAQWHEQQLQEFVTHCHGDDIKFLLFKPYETSTSNNEKTLTL